MIPFVLSAIGGYLIGSSCDCEEDDWKTYIQKGKGGRINFKPSLEFDKIYGTNISKTDWKFPENYDADYVYEKIIAPMFRDNVSTKKVEVFRNYLRKFQAGNYFPLRDIRASYAYEILIGMASGFNYDDIIYFIQDWDWQSKKSQLKRQKIEKELIGLGVDSNDIQWIISPKTFEKIKKQLN